MSRLHKIILGLLIWFAVSIPVAIVTGKVFSAGRPEKGRAAPAPRPVVRSTAPSWQRQRPGHPSARIRRDHRVR